MSGNDFPEDVPGWLSEAEGRELARLAAGKVVLEVGSYLGRSTICLARTARRVHAVDWFRGDVHIGPCWTLPGFFENLDRHGVRDRLVVHVGGVAEVAGALREGAFDLVFLDAAHDLESVRGDIAALSGLVNPRRGLFLFHDYTNSMYPGVRAAADAAFGGLAVPTIVESLAAFALGFTAGDPDGPLLSVVTACSRPENLAAIHANLITSFTRFRVRWLVFCDRSAVAGIPAVSCDHVAMCDGPDCSGAIGKNLGVEAVPSGWLYFLDDDNLIHPRFEEVLWDASRAHPEAQGFVFNQLNADGSRRLAADYEQCVPGNIDLGQYVFDAAIVGEARFPRDEFGSDFWFFTHVRERNKQRVRFVKEDTTYYNFLRP